MSISCREERSQTPSRLADESVLRDYGECNKLHCSVPERVGCPEFLNIAPNTRSLPSNNLNWTDWTDTLSTLAFNRSKTDFATIGLTVDNLFRPETFSYQVLCAYPISGQYSFLARLSYYLLLLFSLILRKHIWLSVAALVTAVVYGATTCAHAFALLV